MGLMDILNQYVGTGAATPLPQAPQHFDQVAQSVPREELGAGLAAAFRSEQTPPFGQMIGNLFDQSGPDVRAGLLQHLLGGLGPSAAGAVGGTALGGLLRDALGRGIAPSDTEQVSRDDVEKAANAAAAHNPGIIDQVAHFYAQHPGLVQTLGNAALTIALSRMAQRRSS